MLTKIMKYDLKYTFKTLLPLYAILFGITGITLFLTLLAGIFPIIKFLSLTLLVINIIGIIAILFATFFVAVRRFYQEFMTDGGYLINTLPVKKSTLVTSNFLTAIFSILITTIVVLIIGGLLLWQNNLLDDIGLLNNLMISFDFSLSTTIKIIAVSLLIVYITQISLCYLAISLGQLHNTDKLVWSGVSWFGLYFLYEICALVFLGILILINPNIINLLNTTIPPVKVICSVIGGILGLSVIFTIISGMCTTYILNNKLNLE